MSHPNSMPPKKLLRDQFGNWIHMTCIATYPAGEAAACARDKKLLMVRGKSAHVVKAGDGELHLYRATAEMDAGKRSYREGVGV